MEIVISGNDASIYRQEASRIHWVCSRRRRYLGPLLFFLFGIFTLVIGATSDSTWMSTTYDNNNGAINSTITKYDYHISLGFGLGLILVALYLVYVLYRQKAIYFRGLSNICSRYMKNSSQFSIRVTQEKVTYQDFESVLEQRWSGFSHYMIYKDNILLITENYYISSIVIQKKRVSEEEYSQLIHFFNKTLKKRKF